MKTKLYSIGLGLMGALLPGVAYAQQSTELGEVENFGELISLLWAYGSQVIMALAVFFVVLGAFFYVASAGNQQRIDQGKEMMFGSLIAIVIVLFSGVLIRTLHKPAEGTAGQLGDIPNVINTATNILVGVIAAFTIVMLTYAALMYILARGDEGRVEKAQRAFRYGVLGLIIGLLAFGIIRAAINFLI